MYEFTTLILPLKEEIHSILHSTQFLLLLIKKLVLDTIQAYKERFIYIANAIIII